MYATTALTHPLGVAGLDPHGNLWVSEYNLPEDGDRALWTVFDPEGVAMGFVETPPGLIIYEIGEDYILGKVEDELRVEHPDALYLDLEDPADAARLANPRRYLDLHRDRLVILDEVQRMPDLFRVLRGRIDARRRDSRRSGHFLLLGSASGALLRQSADSLAGRVAYHELPGLDALETGPDLNRAWLRGGFPDSVTAASDELSMRWRTDFIRTYLERDLPQAGLRAPAETLRRFWTMLAHLQASVFNAAQLARSLGISVPTVNRYADTLVDMMLLRRVQPYFVNVGKRLIKTPKLFIRDSGLMHALLSLRSIDDLLGHPVVGPSWEGFVIENLIGAAPRGTDAFF